MLDYIMTAKEYLQQYNIQITEERVAVVEFLMMHHIHPTGDEVYRELLKEGAEVSRATVFNTLNLLTQKGALHSLTIEEGVVRYDIELEPHAHFRCRESGKIVDIPLKRHASFIIPEGYKVESIDYVISGVCTRDDEKMSEE